MTGDILVLLNFCQGIKNKYSISFCQNYGKVIGNIISISHRFDRCFIINDRHQKDDIEFNYLPRHMLDTPLSLELEPLTKEIKKFECPTTLLDKSTLSAFQNQHNKKVVQGVAREKLVIAGFCGTIDVVPTTLDAMQWHPKVHIAQNCIGDLTPGHKANSINYLLTMGIQEYYT